MLTSIKNLAGLKTKVNNLYLDKLKTVPSNLSKLSNVVDNYIAKKTVYNNLIIKVSAIDIRYQVLVDYSLKHSMIQTTKVLRRRLRMFKKRYPILVGWLKKLQRLKRRYLMLLL